MKIEINIPDTVFELLDKYNIPKENHIPILEYYLDDHLGELYWCGPNELELWLEDEDNIIEFIAEN